MDFSVTLVDFSHGVNSDVFWFEVWRALLDEKLVYAKDLRVVRNIWSYVIYPGVTCDSVIQGSG